MENGDYSPILHPYRYQTTNPIQWKGIRINRHYVQPHSLNNCEYHYQTTNPIQWKGIRINRHYVQPHSLNNFEYRRMKDRSTNILLENGDYSPILHPYHYQTTNPIQWKGIRINRHYVQPHSLNNCEYRYQTTNPIQWKGIRINRHYVQPHSLNNCEYHYQTTNPIQWKGIRINRHYVQPHSLNNCEYRRMKDRSTNILLENGDYSPILHPYR